MAKVSDIMLLQQPEQPVLVIETVTDMNGLSNVIGGGFMKIGAYLEEQGELPADIPSVTYPGYENMNEQNIRLIAGFRLSRALPGKGEIKAVTVPARKIVSCLHRGNYTELAALYNEMSEWIKSNGYQATGTSVEYYYSGPDTPENEQVTRIEMPLK